VSLLEIEVEHDGGATVVRVAGELDLSETTSFEGKMLEVEQGQPPILVIDLRELRFMDSSGLRMILEADARARREARRLVVVQGPEPVHRVFLIALLDKRLEFVEDLEALGDGR
jgi:anti-anti-sigma factor